MPICSILLSIPCFNNTPSTFLRYHRVLSDDQFTSFCLFSRRPSRSTQFQGRLIFSGMIFNPKNLILMNQSTNHGSLYSYVIHLRVEFLGGRILDVLEREKNGTRGEQKCLCCQTTEGKDSSIVNIDNFFCPNRKF